MRPLLAALVTAVLGIAAALLAPRATVNPGELSSGHARIAADCLACHTLLAGVPSAKCARCHPVDRIDRVPADSAGDAPRRGSRASLHAGFASFACTECHTDHAGRDPRAATAFAHATLRPAVRDRCASCHANVRPADATHRTVAGECSACHATTAWKPAGFAHEALATNVRERCLACHDGKRPADAIHRGTGDACGACHSTRAWKPATFAHDRYFPLDRDHAVACVTCHPGPGYATYTCYGCHEHSRPRMIAEHAEEGVRDLDHCVRCHRSPRDREGGEHHGGGHHGD